MKKNKLLVIWSTAEREAALKTVLMYTLNCKIENWWQEVTLLIWGPSQKLLVGDREILEMMDEILAAGVEVIACKQCADDYGLTSRLETLNIDVYYTGGYLTDRLKNGDTVLTF